jgi:hypothetical protein
LVVELARGRTDLLTIDVEPHRGDGSVLQIARFIPRRNVLRGNPVEAR